MKHETKLGMVFIGILLTIFVGLLMKRLARPGNAVLAKSQPATNSTPDPNSSKLAYQAGPPTLVTPKAQSGKPPESSVADNSAKTGNKRSSPTTSKPPAQEPPASPSVSSNEQAPSLLTEVGDRYANKAKDPFDSSSASPSNSGSAQPYRSGYADTNENRSDPRALPSASAGDPSRMETNSPSREKSDPRSSVSNRYSDVSAAEPPRSQPSNRNNSSASNRSPSPSTGDRYAAAPRTPEVYAIPASDSIAPQHYPQANVAVASTGTIVPAAPLQRDGDKYTVGPNDSFWNISERAYGTGAFFKALYEHNRKLHPESDEMKVGQLLSVPDESILRHSYPDLCPAPRKQVAGAQQRLTSASSRMRGTGRVYTVEDGDTLFEIARHELGKTARWAEIYDLNRDVLGNDFDYLRPGLELILPDTKGQTENVTQQPTSVYPR